MIGELLGIQVGKIQKLVMPENIRVDFQHPFWTTGIFKNPVEGPVMVTKSGIDGDQQADLNFHGGPDNVVLTYDVDHYPAWRAELGTDDFQNGSFGENFSIRGFTDETVCIGDTWRVGNTLLLQITQPRQPCYKLARRLKQPNIVKRVRETTHGGWYLRVLEEGLAEKGMSIERLSQPHPDWPISRAARVMYNRKTDPASAQLLATLPELSSRWKQELTED